MTTTTPETRSQIRGLAEAIHEATGRFVTVCEDMHADGVRAISVSIHNGVSFDWFRGSERPLTGHETTIEQMRDNLAQWLVNYRKEEEAA